MWRISACVLVLSACQGCRDCLVWDSFVGDMGRCVCAVPEHFHKYPKAAAAVADAPSGPDLDGPPLPGVNGPSLAPESGPDKPTDKKPPANDKQPPAK